MNRIVINNSRGEFFNATNYCGVLTGEDVYNFVMSNACFWSGYEDRIVLEAL